MATQNLRLTKIFLLLFPIFLVFSGCGETSNEGSTEKTPSLKNAFEPHFYMGAALNRHQINESIPEVSSLLPTEFNSITPENIMKWMYIHPKEDTFNFEMADKFVNLGEKHGMHIIGHTLVWHSQLAPWVNAIQDSAELANHIENHINMIAGRYKGKIHGWDVLNEALNDDGTLRESIFLKVIGEDYIRQAFDLASKADPEAELYYNDYSLVNPNKRKGVVKLVKDLQANGTKIDGVGMQAHWDLNYPALEEIENSILEYSALGVKVMFTELDITVIPNPWDLQGADVEKNFEGSEFMNPYPESLPDSIQNQLAKRYEDIFRIFLKHEDKISRVTFWGIDDGQSWKNDWPIRGRTNYPLLFDRKYQPKKAYYSIMALTEKNDE